MLSAVPIAYVRHFSHSAQARGTPHPQNYRNSQAVACDQQKRPAIFDCNTARMQDRPASQSFVSGSEPEEFYSALVGDAAHPTRPSLGQGANMALEDAVQLGLVLRDTGSVR